MSTSPEPEKTTPDRSSQRRWKRILRGALIYVFVPYVSILVLLSCFQRRLIYLPTHQSHVGIEQARLPKGRVHAISTTTQDGLILNGWHILPDNCMAADRSGCDDELARCDFLVLYFYGNAGSRVNDVYDCRDFTSLGCHVFLFDYRGYGDNDGSPSEAGLAADASAIWEYAVKERGIPPEKILIFGQSLGGAVATRLASEVCEAGTSPAGLILCSTFSSLGDVAEGHYPFLPVRLLLVDRFPSVERIKSVRCPLLSFHGERDDIVPFPIGRRLFEAARDTSSEGIAKHLVEIPQAGHNDVPRTTIQTEVRKLLQTIAQISGK